jgi:hypothetical protein
VHTAITGPNTHDEVLVNGSEILQIASFVAGNVVSVVPQPRPRGPPPEQTGWEGIFDHDCTTIMDAKLKMNVARAWAKLKQIDTNGDDTLAWEEYQHASVDKFKDDPLEHQTALERNKKRSVDTDIDTCCPKALPTRCSLTCARMC